MFRWSTRKTTRAGCRGHGREFGSRLCLQPRSMRRTTRVTHRYTMQHARMLTRQPDYCWMRGPWSPRKTTTVGRRCGLNDAHKIAAVQHGADVNAKDIKGWTPLHSAAREDAHKTAGLLSNTEPMSMPRTTMTGRHCAADLHYDPTRSRWDIKGWMPLYLAARGDAHKTAKVLLNEGALVNAKNNRTPLYFVLTRRLRC